ncbi:FHA domain-containing protein [candidate division KSB1 bacterium]|nr:FHA domain-containing protein [candidate division KSB1 bacterium]
MARLIIQRGNASSKILHLKKGTQHIGRTSENEIYLDGCQRISRKHAQIVFRDHQFFICDLGSTNGTIINGQPLTRNTYSKLAHNDRIQVGSFILRFESDAGGEFVENDDFPIVLSEQDLTSKNVVRDATKFLEAVEKSPLEIESNIDGAIIEVRHKSKILQILNRVEKELISIKPINEYLKLVMDLAFEVVEADRGFLMLIDEATGKLVPKEVKFKQDPLLEADKLIRISKTIARKVTEEKVAIITPDAIMDDRFGEGDSIFHMGIRSAMCVPLWNKDKVLGIIYVDNLASSASFNNDDLALLIAFANHAAIGIEQARLNERIQQEIKIRSQLERYHSPELINRIIQQDRNVHLEAQETEVTVLFADIVGFTPMIENMPPKEVSEMLNEFYTLASEAIFKYEGTLDKFIGDNVMAIFGAPVAHENDPELAVLSAFEMLERLQYLNMDKPANRQITLRIGINTGKAIAGDFGSLKRMEYTVLGDTVNIAERIESAVASPNQVAVGEITYQRTSGLFDYTALGEFKVKGKANTIKAYLATRPVEGDGLIY